MKSLNVKKLAALAVGATMVMGTAAAAVANNLPTDRSWYLDSKIVVGSGAAASDVVSAAEISAAIAQLAYKKAEIQASTGEAKVKIETPGQIVVGGQGYHYDDAELNYAGSEFKDGLELGKAKIPTLVENKDITVKYRASKDDSWEDDDATYTQKLVVAKDGIDIDKYVNDNKFDLKMVVPDDGVSFRTEVKNLDIPVGHTYSKDGKTLDNFEIDILGTKYKVTKLKVDASGDGTIEISKYSSEKAVNVGDSVSVGEYTVKVAGVYGEDTPYAVLELYDSQGNLISKDKVGEDEDADFDEVDVRVEEVVPGDNGWVKLSLDSESATISLSSRTGHKDDFPVDDWRLNVTVDSDANYIHGITFDVTYHDSDYDDAEHGLKVGDKLKFPGDEGYAVVFAGLKQETMHSLKIDGDEITALDKDGDAFTSKLVDDKTVGKDFERKDDYKIFEFSNFLNDKTVAVRIVDTDDNGSTGNLNDDKFDVAIDYDYSGDEDEFTADGEVANVTLSDLQTGVPISVDVTDQDDLNLEVFVTNLTKDGKIYLAFQSNNADSMSKDVPYKIVVDWANKDAATSDYDRYDINVFTKNLGASDKPEIVIPFRTDNDKLSFKEIKLGNDGDDVKAYLAGDYKSEQDLDSDSDSDSTPDSAILQDGTEVYVKSSDTVEISVPEESRKVDVFFGIPAQTEESSSVMELGEGETIPGTNYKIVGIEGTANVSGTYYEEVKDLDPTSMVYLDTQEPSGNLIVVGGFAINQIAAKIEALKQDLTKENTKVVKYYPASDTGLGSDAIVVAGWTADDTMAAAREFINFLKTSVQ